MANNIYDSDNLELLIHTNNKIEKVNYGSAAYRDAAEPNTSWNNINDTDLVDKIQVDNRIGNNNQVFIAKFGTTTEDEKTTYDEIETAYRNGKAVFAVDKSNPYFKEGLYSLYTLDEGVQAAHFVKITQNNLYTVVCAGTGWNAVEVKPLEFTQNKITSISSSSTNLQYPSAKAVYDALAEKQDELTAGNNITIENNVISATGGADNIFIAEYEVTTFDEIEAANNAGKVIFLHHQTPEGHIDGLYPLTHMLSGIEANFYKILLGGNLYWMRCIKDGGWFAGSENIFETTENKVINISSSSTDTQYPSAKAVYNALAGNSNVFIAQYNETTFDELLSEYNAHKLILTNYYYPDYSTDGSYGIYMLTGYDPNVGKQGLFYFSKYDGNNHYSITVRRVGTSDTGWGPAQKSNFESQSSRLNYISYGDYSRNEYYPSIGAVARFVADVRDGIIEPYDEEKSYSIGDYCGYYNWIYRCTVATPQSGESFDINHWELITLDEELKAIVDNINLKENTSNKVTSMSESSTDTQYPSAKAVQDKFSNLVKEYSSAIADTQIAYGQGTEEIEVLTTADVETKVLSITDSGVTTNYNVLVVVNNGN